ncbi:MAG: hypothetical protein HF312_07995 [Ignavibacteria bacterium]|jgi:hypothetical protein|nr:hypothetical protein [Ignavibacteria bacterium]MCU7520148.1 hypothetical protein [Ignavibacteria bacterium]
MLLRITNKLAQKLKEMPLPDETVSAESPLDEWYGNLFTWNRTQYIIFTNAHSLYSVILPGKGINNPYRLVQAAVIALSEAMKHEGYDDFLNMILKYTSNITISKTISRSVLGSMNDMVFIAKTFLSADPEMDLYEISHRINNTPYKYGRDYSHPSEEIKKLLI